MLIRPRRRPDDPRRVDEERVERDGVGQVHAVLDQVDVDRLPHRNVECRHDAQEQSERDQVPDLYATERGEDREHDRLQQHQRLREVQRATAVDAVSEHARPRAERENARVRTERHDAEQPCRAREPVGEPAHRDLLQPRAHVRQALPDEEQAEIAMPQRAKRPDAGERHH